MLARYKHSCGPAVVASVLGVPRVTAAAMLVRVREKRVRRRTFTYMTEIGVVLEKRVITLRRRKRLYTWLRDHADREAVLRVGRHFIHVRHGQAIETNGLLRPNAIVTHVIYLDTKEGGVRK